MVGFLCFRGVARLRDPDIKDVEAWIRKLGAAGHALLFATAGFTMFLALILSHLEARELLLSDVSNVSMVSDLADGRQLLAMERLIPVYTGRYYQAGGDIPERDVLCALLLDEQGIRTEEVAGATSDEIIRRLDALNHENIDVLDLLIVILAGMAGFCYPGMTAVFDSALKNGRIRDEIMQFQTVISMEKDVPGMTTVTILESLEQFAGYFSDGLRKCLNGYGTNDTEALSRLKYSYDNRDFARIVDCFMAADEVGVGEAFDEISAEINVFREDRRSERMIILDTDVLLASLMSVIPGALILFGYLLIPFMVSALGMFEEYQSSLKDYISIT